MSFESRLKRALIRYITQFSPMIICGKIFGKNYPNQSHEPADQQLNEDYNPQNFIFCPYQVLASSFSSKLLLKVCELAQLFGFENSISTNAKIYKIL